ncbi:diguanylate cyclase domain-containing protein [Methylomonas sp. HW2-6]|uniref:diguanylate cyclase domain-containing protein n=1 Tax=Methylomonas sp. HW2-6 TaxID=3376687 RepID=UPI003D4470C2
MKNEPNLFLNPIPAFSCSDNIAASQWLKPTSCGTAPGKCEPLNQNFAEIAELQKALALSQRQLADAKRQIEALNADRAELSQQLQEAGEHYHQALHAAHHDALTGLANRTLLQDRLQQAMARTNRQQSQLALLFIDLDDFKAVNDTLGHAAGDRLLTEVANRLQTCIRNCDTACRYGGDEFLVLLTDIENSEQLNAVIDKVYENLIAPYASAIGYLTLDVSIGTAIYRRGKQSWDELIRQADQAMYRAKAAKV